MTGDDAAELTPEEPLSATPRDPATDGVGDADAGANASAGTPKHRERRSATDAEARALASSLRLRILRLTLDEPLTNKEIAEALDRNPASVLHHVRTLVDTGFLRAEAVRRGTRGSREIPYRATGKSWNLDTHGVTAGPIVEAFVSEIGTVPAHQRELSRMRLNGSDLEEFRKRLYELVTDFYERPRDTQSAPHSVFIAMHPDTSTPRRHAPGPPAKE
ncbi:helix-turn-helix domain-containing protein [Ornithinimicrobium faecis]|uniref:helix-turn-helix domain-containing protein n=1 Tax=Ornithinimicrobium faecis TaxID=2934158 RepID=UPI0021174FFC|nr:helix-turn-helix domain-containing protein [Ornithinimicrobium sp. HY1745]